MCTKLKKFFAVCIIVCVTVCCICSTAFAASKTYSTYNDAISSTSYIQNLLTLRSKKQATKNYIAFRTESEYVLVIADKFNVNGSSITCDDCDIIAYNSSYGANNSTRYYSTSYDSCTVTKNHVIVSNCIDGSSRPDSSDYNQTVVLALVIIIAILAFWVIRRFK